MQNAANKSWWDRLKPCVDLHGVGVFFVSFAIYLITAPSTVTFEDSGLFILSGYYGGIPHPPGYPLYTFLAHVFSQVLPFSTVAFRISLLSATLGAFSAVMGYQIFRQFSDKKTLATLTALVFATAATVWGQMIVAEVYALHVFLSLLFVLQCLHLQKQPSEKGFFVLGLIGALNLANHWPLFVLAGPSYLFLTKKHWWTKKFLGYFFVGLSFALVPYMLMWWRSNATGLEVAFLGPIENFSELIKYFARSYYGATDASVLHTWVDKTHFFMAFVKSLGFKDFSLLLAPLFFVGVWQLRAQSQRPLALALTLMLLSSSVLLLFFLKLEFNDLNLNVQKVFWLMPFFAYLCFAYWGAHFLDLKIRYLGTGFVALALVAQILLNYHGQNLRNDTFAEDYGRTILASVPAGATLVASTDGDVGPVAYVHHVLKVNPSVEMYTGTGVFFKNRIFDPYIMSLRARRTYATEFIKQKKVVFSVKTINVFDGMKELPIASTFNGLTYRYTPFAEPAQQVTEEVVQLAVKALDGYVKNRHIENWPYHRGTLAARLCNLLVLKGQEAHEVFTFSAECQQVLARHLMATGRREAADAMYLKYLANLKYPITREKQQYVYHFLINRLEIVNQVKGQPEQQRKMIAEALVHAEKTLFEYPLCDNMVYPVLKSIRGQVSLSAAAEAQLQVFTKCEAKL